MSNDDILNYLTSKILEASKSMEEIVEHLDKKPVPKPVPKKETIVPKKETKRFSILRK